MKMARKITITGLESTELAGGRLQWTITAKIGTAGSRELSLIPVSEEFGAMTAQKCDIEITEPENANDIIDAEFDVRAARVNSPFELTAIAGG